MTQMHHTLEHEPGRKESCAQDAESFVNRRVRMEVPMHRFVQQREKRIRYEGECDGADDPLEPTRRLRHEPQQRACRHARDEGEGDVQRAGDG